ncbi:MAG: molybdopterin-binding protein [Bacillota bacterium]
MKGKIVAVCSSENKGERKKNIGRGRLIPRHGLEGDAHAGPWHRQVSLLAQESIDKMVAAGLQVGPGDFAENLTTQGISLVDLPIGTRLRFASGALGEVTQIGKECHTRCAIYHQAGDCVMPREGIFIKIIKGGEVALGDSFEVTGAFTALVITASDKGSRGQREDVSGPTLARRLEELGLAVLGVKVVPDERRHLEEALIEACDEGGTDLVLTTGGTGLSPRDVTPEATLAVIQRPVPGISEAIRAASMQITPLAMLTRGVAGIRGNSLIINLPGSVKAVQECLAVIEPVLPHALEKVRGAGGDCGRS